MAYFLTMGMSSTSNEAGNYSTINFSIYLNSTNGQSYSGYNGMTIDWSVGGIGGSAGAPSAASCAGGAAPLVASGSYNIGHNPNGYLGTVGGSSTFNGSGGYAPGSISASASTGTTDYDRKPATATFASIVRTTNSVAVAVAGVSSPAGTPTYYVERNSGSGWGDQRTGANVTYSGLALSSTQQFRTFATNSDGTGGTTTSGSYAIPNVPTAPTISVSAPSGKALTVTAGTSADNGATVTGYSCQVSADDGVTWGTAQAMTSQSVSLTALTGGATYKFRVYSTNEMGNSGFTTSASVFIPSGGRRWNGTALVPTTLAKRWNGTAWVDLTIAKRWNGTSWVDLA